MVLPATFKYPYLWLKWHFYMIKKTSIFFYISKRFQESRKLEFLMFFLENIF